VFFWIIYLPIFELIELM